ncbi:F-box/WD repeat-containing protein 9 [Stigmatopora argus]
MQSPKEERSVARVHLTKAASDMDDAGINKGSAVVKDGEQSEPSHEFVESDTSSPKQQMNNTSSDISPSASPEASGLLSLPWEMISQIVSHLPAHCVISVLPKVCCALRNIGKDSTAWQLRSRRLIGSTASFPVGPREDFDWPVACLELEKLISGWSSVAQVVIREPQDVVADYERVGRRPRALQDELPAAEEQQDDGVGVPEPERVGVIEEAYDGEEGVVFGEEHLDQLREVLDEGLEDHPEPGNGDFGDQPILFEGQNDAPDHQQHEPVGLQEHEEYQPSRSPSPPPALECVTLLSGHIGAINSILLLGGDGAVCATGSRDWDVKLWNLQADSGNMLMHTLTGQGHFNTHQGWVWCLASQGPLLASGGSDETVRLWDLQACGAERGVIKTEAVVICMSYLQDVLLAGTFNKKVLMYDPRAAVPLVKTLKHHSNSILCMAADDKYVISASRDNTVVVHDRRADKRLIKVRLRSYLRSMSYSGSEIWGGDLKGKLRCFSIKQGIIKRLSWFDVGHTAMITGIYKSPGSLYTCSSDFSVKAHIPCGPPKTLCTMRHQEGVLGLSVEAGILAVALGNMCVEIWRPTKSETVKDHVK